MWYNWRFCFTTAGIVMDFFFQWTSNTRFILYFNVILFLFSNLERDLVATFLIPPLQFYVNAGTAVWNVFIFVCVVSKSVLRWVLYMSSGLSSHVVQFYYGNFVILQENLLVIFSAELTLDADADAEPVERPSSKYLHLSLASAHGLAGPLLLLLWKSDHRTCLHA